MKYFLISSVLIGVLAAASAVSFFDVVKEEWHAFKVRIKWFGKKKKNKIKSGLAFYYFSFDIDFNL